MRLSFCLRTGLALAAVAASAAATILAFPPTSLTVLAPIALAPLAATLEGQRPRLAFLLGFLYLGTVLLVFCRWLAAALRDNWEVRPLAAWVVIAMFVAGYSSITGACASIYTVLRPHCSVRAAPLVFAALWTLGEWLRADPLIFPWVLASHMLAPWPVTFQIADSGGMLAVSFVLVSLSAGIGLALVHRSAWPLLPGGALVAASVVYGHVRLAEAPRGELLRVGVLQGALGPHDRFRDDSPLLHTVRLAESTRRMASETPLDLALWFETAVDGNLDESPAAAEVLELLSTQLDVPIVTGALRGSGDSLINAAVLILPHQGIAETYAKQALVPYAEFTPPFGAQFAPYLGSVMARIPYSPGDEPTVFRTSRLTMGATVCWEMSYAQLARHLRLAGAQLLLNLSNDGWFAVRGYPEIHLFHSIFRAVELRTWVVRATNGGVSAFVDSYGRVARSLPFGTEGHLIGEVRASKDLSVYSRHGDLPILFTCLGLLAWPAARTASGRRETGERED